MAAQTSYVKRTTMFKLDEQHIDGLLKQYETMRKDAVKDGEPYIVSNTARRVLNTSAPVSDGFTFVSQTIFRSLEDNEYYDKQCKAHAALREFVAPIRKGVLTLVTEGEWPEPRL